MPLLCFVLDTSSSMNQKTIQGQRLIDHAKTAIENFINKVRCRDPSARTDQYVLITTQDDGLVRVGLKDSQMTFWSELRTVQAHGLSNLGSAIQVAFDLINCERWESELDTIGRGRIPWMIKPTSIIILTDGGKLTSNEAIKGELVIPGSNLPGMGFIKQPFRWDQRVFSLTLKMNGTEEAEANKPLSAMTDHMFHLCDATGGRNHIVTTPKGLMESLHAVGSRLAGSSGTGVVVKFEKINEKLNSRPELSNGANGETKPWHSTQSIVNVRQNYKSGNFTGFWPIPESYWPDPNESQCPPRNAVPVLKFSCKDHHPKCLNNFAFDKLELESSPLTVAMLERKQKNDWCWQVFVENSGKFGGMGKPIGYLKPNSQNTVVNLFIHPYDYEEALMLIEELFRSNMAPSPQWRKQWDEYLANIPNYYISHFRKALVQARAPAGIIQDAFDVKLNSAIQSQLKKIKLQLRTESERLQEQMKKTRLDLGLEKMIQVKPVTEESSNQTEFVNFEMMNPQRNIRKRPYLEAFDVERKTILSQLNRMRTSFRQCLRGGTPIHKEHVLHEQIISHMGNYQEYLKKSVVPLRDPHADPDMPRAKAPTFGNPWKRDKAIDVDGLGVDVDGLNERVPGRSDRKRSRKQREDEKLNKKNKICHGILSLRSPRRSDSDSTTDSSSDTDSDCSEGEMKIDEKFNQFKHHNGFGHEYTNGHHNHTNAKEKVEDENHKARNPHNEKIYQRIVKDIKNFGFQRKTMYGLLNELERDDPDELSYHLRKLMMEAIRFRRPELLTLIEGFQQSLTSEN